MTGIQSPTEWTEIKNQEPPVDTMLLVSGNPYDQDSESVLEDVTLVVLAFKSSRSNSYIAVDQSCECISEWMVPTKYHVVYNPEGDIMQLSSRVEVN